MGSISGVVELQERNVQVTVYYYKGDEGWGQHFFDSATEALPILEDLFGCPYPHGFDVVIYPKRSEEINMWNAQNLMEQGIFMNRDRFTPENLKYWSTTAVLIHEVVHYWSDDAIYSKPWLMEGYCELFAYLTLEKMGRADDAVRRKKDWSREFEEKKYYDIPLDKFDYEMAGPGNETTLMAYSKSALFCYEIYDRYGLEPIQEINRFLYRNGITADSLLYMRLLEQFTGEYQKELFIGWVFPKRLDAELWQEAENKVGELEELTLYSIASIEEKYGFNIHLSTKIGQARTYIWKFEFEEALGVLNEEIERVNTMVSEFDGYALDCLQGEKCVTSQKFVFEQLLTVFQEYESTGKELEKNSVFEDFGLLLQGKNKESFNINLASAREEIKNGNLDNASTILTHTREQLSKARLYGGIVFGVTAFLVGSALVIFIKRRKRKSAPQI